MWVMLLLTPFLRSVSAAVSLSMAVLASLLVVGVALPSLQCRQLKTMNTFHLSFSSLGAAMI